MKTFYKSGKKYYTLLGIFVFCERWIIFEGLLFCAGRAH